MEHSDGQDGQDRQAEVTMAEWERRKEFVGFTNEDARLLRDLSLLSEAYADEVVEELSQQFMRFEETRAFFPDTATQLGLTLGNIITALDVGLALDTLTDTGRRGDSHER